MRRIFSFFRTNPWKWISFLSVLGILLNALDSSSASLEISSSNVRSVDILTSFLNEFAVVPISVENAI